MATPAPAVPPRPVPSWFRRARQARGLTQLELAQLVGMSPSRLSLLERGQISHPEWERKLRAFFKGA